MKTFQFPIFLLLSVFAFSALLPSCKEKNNEYPPRIWSEYAYSNSGIELREISVIFYENDHSTWLGSKNSEGLLYYDGYKWSAFNQENTGIEFDSVTSFVRDGEGILWIGWKNGLSTFDGSKWTEIIPFKGLCVTSVAVEGISNIRVGIKGESGGVALWQNNEWTFSTVSESEIPSGNINSLVSDNDQLLWLATADKGIIRLKNTAWENMSEGLSLLSDEFTCITLAPDGSIWAGSSSSQLIHFYDDTFTVFNTGTSKPVSSVLIAGNGELWCGTLGGGLIKFDGLTWKSFTVENSALPTNEIFDIAEGSEGIILFSIPGGKVLMIKE
jgi:ligand-binding sensor domain-containing protein